MNDRRVHARFLPSGETLELLTGERVLDAVDDQHPRCLLPTACRAGNCGTCLVRVHEGARWLEPPAAEERAVLAEFGCAADQRLGCQVYVCSALPPETMALQVVFERLPRSSDPAAGSD